MKMPWLSALFEARKSKFTVQIPAAPGDVERYYKVLATLFGQDIIPPLSFLKAIPKINPYGLIIVDGVDGAALGGIELYGLKRDFFDKYLDGKAKDSDFRAQHLLDPDHVIADGRLYCAITTDEARLKALYGRQYTKNVKEVRDHLLVATVAAIKEAYFSKTSAPAALSIYAIAASQPGKALLKQIGFREISNGEERLDKTPLYRLDLNRNEVDRILEATLSPPDKPERASPAKRDELKVKKGGRRRP